MIKYSVACATILALTPVMSVAEEFDYHIRVVPGLTQQHINELQKWAAKTENFGSYAVSTADPKFDSNGVEIPQPGVSGQSTGYNWLWTSRWNAVQACNAARTGDMGRCVVIGSRVPNK